jgi:ubiquinone/menaquinone biosynthesis C-methylase UbiE
MSLYEEKILPHIIDRACSIGQVMKLRSQVVPQARGTVLEVGMGSGLNLEFYDADKVDLVYGLEPSTGMRKKARPNLAKSKVKVEWLDLPGEQIPLADNSVDTVLLTFTLCTIPDWQAALEQMKRVLRPDGELLFLEHGQQAGFRIMELENLYVPKAPKIAGYIYKGRARHV